MLYIANDHAGYKLKIKLLDYLKKQNIEYVDLGTDSTDSVDFPIYCRKVVAELAKSDEARGILICGSGVGMSICANRSRHIRAGLCLDAGTARLARQHNNINTLVLAGRKTSISKAKKIVKAFLYTECYFGKYKKRMDMIDEK